uniref:Uncharacterized protein n=1 Tax=Rhizophagus irregularis (strain DAOM 181602 / DAOM 197198 / MUCL 43194) TaxID=747089 RepID=U9UNB3_RHIID
MNPVLLHLFRIITPHAHCLSTPPEISLTSGKENIIHLYQRASDTEGLAMKANQKEILSWSKIRKSSLA